MIYLQRPYIILNKCDNTPGCPVIEACPQDIFHYDYNVKKLLLNDSEPLPPNQKQDLKGASITSHIP